MNAVPIVLGLLAAGGLAYTLTSKKEEPKKTVQVDPPDMPGINPPGAPPVPVVNPSAGVIRFGVQDWNNAVIFQDILDKKGAAVAMMFADMTMLLQEATVKDYAAYAAWLQSEGIGGVASYATARIANMRKGGYNFGLVFDGNLPVAIRSWLEFQTFANRWSDFKANLQSAELAKYPLFRDSMWKAFSDRIGNPPEKSKPDGQDNPPGGGGIDAVSQNFVGPGAYTSGYGTVMVPVGGRVVDGKPMHIIQEGQWGVASIAKAWGKEFPDTWIKSVLAQNPSLKWGEGGNVHPGTVVDLPISFLDPYAVPPASPGGSGGTKQPGSPDKVPEIPDPPPGMPKPGHVWVPVPGGGWLEVPIDPTNQA